MPAADVPPLCGLVLAGGSSRRLGTDKAAVPLGDQTLLEHAVRVLVSRCDDVRVSVRADQLDDPLRARFRCLTDPRGGIGPAAGLLAAHMARPEAAWLVLACDMAWVTERMLDALLAARDGSRAGVAYRRAGVVEPLCALYEPATLAAFRRQIEAGGPTSPRDWLAAADPVLLDSSVPSALDSVNRPEDLGRLTGTPGSRRQGPANS